MLQITNEQELYEYALRALGAPIHNIEITDEQACDRIGDVLQQFLLRHYNAVTERFIPVCISTDTSARGYIQLPEEVVAVTEVLRATSTTSGEEFERLNFLIKDTEIFDRISKGGVSNYMMARSQIAQMQDILNPEPGHIYNAITGQLSYHGNLEAGRLLFLHTYIAVNPEEFPNVYNNEWVKKATIAHIQKQWGMNLKKMLGIQLAGGVELNGQAIYDDAMRDIDTLNEEYSLRYELPVDGFIS